MWNENVASLPIHFGMSGLNSAVAILELRGHNHRALNLLGTGASFVETVEGIHLETTDKPAIEPLKRGVSGLITRVGGVLSGPIPVVLRLTAAFASNSTARRLRKAAALSSIAGSLLTRIAWVRAGHISAKDWRSPLGLHRLPDKSPSHKRPTRLSP